MSFNHPTVAEHATAELNRRGIQATAARAGWRINGAYWQYPLYDLDEQVIPGVSRKKRIPGSDASAKYLWSGNTDIKPDTYLLPGTTAAISAANGQGWLVNGEASLLAHHAAGLANVIATTHSEAKVPDNFVATLEKLNIATLLYAPDNDATGRRSARNFQKSLANSGIKLILLDLSAQVDEKGDTGDLWQVCDFARRRFAETLFNLPPLILPQEAPSPAPRRTYGDTVRDRDAAIRTLMQIYGISDKRPNHSGWINFNSPYREDQVASAGFNIESGYFYDFNGDAFSLWEQCQHWNIEIGEYKEEQRNTKAQRRKADKEEQRKGAEEQSREGKEEEAYRSYSNTVPQIEPLSNEDQRRDTACCVHMDDRTPEHDAIPDDATTTRFIPEYIPITRATMSWLWNVQHWSRGTSGTIPAKSADFWLAVSEQKIERATEKELIQKTGISRGTIRKILEAFGKQTHFVQQVNIETEKEQLCSDVEQNYGRPSTVYQLTVPDFYHDRHLLRHLAERICREYHFKHNISPMTKRMAHALHGSYDLIKEDNEALRLTLVNAALQQAKNAYLPQKFITTLEKEGLTAQSGAKLFYTLLRNGYHAAELAENTDDKALKMLLEIIAGEASVQRDLTALDKLINESQPFRSESGVDDLKASYLRQLITEDPERFQRDLMVRLGMSRTALHHLMKKAQLNGIPQYETVTLPPCPDDMPQKQYIAQQVQSAQQAHRGRVVEYQVLFPNMQPLVYDAFQRGSRAQAIEKLEQHPLAVMNISVRTANRYEIQETPEILVEDEEETVKISENEAISEEKVQKETKNRKECETIEPHFGSGHDPRWLWRQLEMRLALIGLYRQNGNIYDANGQCLAEQPRLKMAWRLFLYVVQNPQAQPALAGQPSRSAPPPELPELPF